MGLTASAWIFGCAALGLAVLGLSFILWPVIRRKRDDIVVSRKEINVDLYKARAAELEEAVRLGEVSTEDAETQRLEAARHLLEDTAAEQPEAINDKDGRGRWVYAIAALFLPVFALFIYLQGDGWRLINANDKAPPWDFIIHRAEERLASNPNDEETWVFLARSHRALEQYKQSAEAYAAVNRLNQDSNPDLLVEEGEMLAMLDEGNMRGLATERFNKALEVNPQHGRALWYAGLAALQRENTAKAIEHWQTLSQQELPESFRLVLERQLKRIGAEPLAPPPVVQLPAVIRVRVEADSVLTGRLPKDAMVFVYARSPQGSGPPLAAKRIRLDDLPATVELNDGMAMAGSMKLSAFDEWRVTARISKSGQPQSEAGDPFGQILLTTENALKNRVIKIDKQWPQ